jgi:hypothetical protein
MKLDVPVDLQALFRTRCCAVWRSLTVAAVHSNQADHSDKLQRFEDGSIDILIAIRLVNRAYSNPQVGHIAHLCPTPPQSYSEHMQRNGRGARTVTERSAADDPTTLAHLQVRPADLEQRQTVYVLDATDPMPLYERFEREEQVPRVIATVLDVVVTEQQPAAAAAAAPPHQQSAAVISVPHGSHSVDVSMLNLLTGTENSVTFQCPPGQRRLSLPIPPNTIVLRTKFSAAHLCDVQPESTTIEIDETSFAN